MLKRGSWEGAVLYPAFEVLMAVMVGLALLWFIHGLGEKTAFEKRFLATDLALILDTIPAMPQPGNLYLLYNPQRSEKFEINYSFRFASSKVEVMTKQGDRSPGVSYFTPDPAIVMQAKEFLHKGAMVYPIFLKQGEQLIIDDINARKAKYVREVLPCDGPKTIGLPAVSAVHATGPEAVKEQDLAKIVQGALGPGTAAGRLGVRIGSTSPDRILIKAYVNGENDPALLAQSQRVGCEVANAVLSYWETNNIDVKGIAVIPVNIDHTASPDDNAVLAKGAVGVLLELDTLQKPGLFDDIEKQVRPLALAIADGVKHAQS